MACKIAIMAKDSGRFFAGDCVEAHKVSVYMGGSVEPVGGDLRVTSLLFGLIFIITNPLAFY